MTVWPLGLSNCLVNVSLTTASKLALSHIVSTSMIPPDPDGRDL